MPRLHQLAPAPSSVPPRPYVPSYQRATATSKAKAGLEDYAGSSTHKRTASGRSGSSGKGTVVRGARGSTASGPTRSLGLTMRTTSPAEGAKKVAAIVAADRRNSHTLRHPPAPGSPQRRPGLSRHMVVSGQLSATYASSSRTMTDEMDVTSENLYRSLSARVPGSDLPSTPPAGTRASEIPSPSTLELPSPTDPDFSNKLNALIAANQAKADRLARVPKSHIDVHPADVNPNLRPWVNYDPRLPVIQTGAILPNWRHVEAKPFPAHRRPGNVGLLIDDPMGTFQLGALAMTAPPDAIDDLLPPKLPAKKRKRSGPLGVLNIGR